MTKIRQVFWFALLLKLILAAAMPLTNDEAYYWVWSRHMQLSYYDHPPFVAWLFWLGDFLRRMVPLAGVVRWPGVLMGHATLAIWLKLLKPYLEPRQRFVWLCLALFSPLVGGSALLVTPDLPLMFFYGLSLALWLRLTRVYDWRLALALGVSLGLGFSSKYMMVLFALSLLPVVMLDRSWRGLFFRALPMILAGGLLGATPVWLWNLLNDFASFKFQANHGLGLSRWKPSWTYEYLLGQAGLIFPVVLYWAVRSRRLPSFFHWLAWTPVFFFLVMSARSFIEANWPLVAYPPILALAVSYYPENRRSLWGTAALWSSAWSVMAVIVVLQPAWARQIKLREFHQFDAVTEAAREISPLFARSYQMAAKMSFDLQRPICKLKGMNRVDFYDFLPESEPPAHSVYYLAVQTDDRLPKAYTEGGHRVLERIPAGEGFEIWKMESP